MNIKKRRAAFSFLEIMVVICIVGILATMLFPTLSRIRKQSQKRDCMNTLRHIGVHMSIYMEGSGRGVLYPTYGQGVAAKSRGADFVVGLYNSSNEDLREAGNFQCAAQSQTTLAYSHSEEAVPTNYAGWDDASGNNLYRAKQSQTAIISDWDETHIANHSDGLNVLFADFHVSFVPWGSFHTPAGDLLTDKTACSLIRDNDSAAPLQKTYELRGLLRASIKDSTKKEINSSSENFDKPSSALGAGIPLDKKDELKNK